MIDRQPSPVLDPTRDAALLLQRMGFFTLGVALPISAMLSRRAAVVLAPAGVALLVIAAFLLEPDRLFRSFGRRVGKATALALGLLAFWALLSTQWAPPGASGGDRALNMLFALGLGLAGISALSEKTRTANLNAVAIGLGLSALMAAGAVLFIPAGVTDMDQTLVVRTMALVVILVPPLACWLLLRGRTGGAGLLALAAALAVAVTATPVITAAFAAALAAALAVFRFGAPAVRRLSLAMAVIVLLAPAAAMLAHLGGMGSRASGAATLLSAPVLAPVLAPLADWGSVIARAPARIVTGFGFDAITAQAQAGLLPGAPASVIFEIWHELGMIGAAAFAAALWFAMRAVLVLPRIMQAGAIAAYASAFILGLFGLATLRAWWLMTIAAGVVLITAVARGHGRTSRPVAKFLRDSETAKPA
jgi:hypothetical protein